MKSVLLLGDSIRMGYCRYVKEELKDIAEVCYPEKNCEFTQYTLVELPKWINLVGDPKKVDVIHWNNGHWDIAHRGKEDVSLNTPEQYAVMLERIYRKMRALCPNSKIIFALTTPMNPDGDGGNNPRTNAEIEQYNSVACNVMNKLGVQINNLYSVISGQPSSIYIDHAHLSENGYQLLAKTVLKVITENL